MSSCIFVECCSAGGKYGRGTVENLDHPISKLRMEVAPPLVAPVPVPGEMLGRARMTAIHEAGHAVAARYFGGHVAQIRIDPPRICSAHPIDAVSKTHIANFVFSMAGPIAEDRARGRWGVLSSDLLKFYIGAVRKDEAGRCDYCCAVRAVVEEFPSASDDEIIGRFHEHLRLANDIVRRPATWWLIEAVADVLMERGEILHAEFEALIQEKKLAFEEYLIEKG